jgi:hypothetical protein
MASESGTKKNGRKKSKQLKYFYLNGNLHKSLHKNRSTDTIITWCYPLAKRVAYTYSDVRKNMETAFTTKEVANMVHRTRQIVEMAIVNGQIEEPQYTYSLNENRNKYQYLWHERDIMALHGYLSTVHIGRPRKDGLITASRLPSARELRAMIRQQPVMGYLDNEGNFIPTWLAEDL